MGFLDAQARDAATDRALQIEVAAGNQKLGDVLGNPNRASLGEGVKALETYDKALRVLAPVLAADPGNLSARLLAAQIRVQQAGTRTLAAILRKAFRN